MLIVADVVIGFTVDVAMGRNAPEYKTVLRNIFLQQKGRDVCYYFVSENGWSEPPLWGSPPITTRILREVDLYILKATQVLLSRHETTPYTESSTTAYIVNGTPSFPKLPQYISIYPS